MNVSTHSPSDNQPKPRHSNSWHTLHKLQSPPRLHHLPACPPARLPRPHTTSDRPPPASWACRRRAAPRSTPSPAPAAAACSPARGPDASPKLRPGGRGRARTAKHSTHGTVESSVRLHRRNKPVPHRTQIPSTQGHKAHGSSHAPEKETAISSRLCPSGERSCTKTLTATRCSCPPPPARRHIASNTSPEAPSPAPGLGLGREGEFRKEEGCCSLSAHLTQQAGVWN